MKQLLTILLGIIIISNFSFSQNTPVDKNAVWLTGLASYTNLSGEIYEDSKGNSFSSITLSPSLNYFVSPNFFIAGNLGFSYQAQGSNDATSFSIGPSIGYAFGNQKSTAFPYLTVGISYKSISSGSTSLSGSDILVGFGIMVQAANHLGIGLELGYHKITLESHPGNALGFGVGIAGLFY